MYKKRTNGRKAWVGKGAKDRDRAGKLEFRTTKEERAKRKADGEDRPEPRKPYVNRRKKGAEILERKRAKYAKD